MSALTDRIAAEHDTYLTYLTGGDLRASCEGCDWTFEGDSIDAVVECSRHVAAVTEAAVREQVARDGGVMKHHPHRPDWRVILIDVAIFAAIFTALLTATAAVTLITTGRLT